MEDLELKGLPGVTLLVWLRIILLCTFAKKVSRAGDMIQGIRQY